MRRLIWATHRYCGLAIAVFLLVAALTGCLLVFRPQLDAALNPHLLRVAARPGQPAVAVVEMVRRAHPDWQIQAFDLAIPPGDALCLTLAALADGSDQACVDPADGRLTGLRSTRAAASRAGLLQAVFVLHYTLFAGTAGRWFMGVMALAWLVLSVLGVLITVPRRRWLAVWWRAALTSRQAWRRRPLPELHRVAGLWLALLMCGEAYTSVAMNFFDEAFRPLVEAVSPPRASPFDAPVPASAKAGTQPAIGFAAALRDAGVYAAAHTPALSPVSIAEDRAHGFYNVSFSPGGTLLYEGFGRVTYSVGRTDGHLAWIDQPKLDGVGRLLVRSLYPLHTGQVFGVAGQMAVLVVGLATCVLVVTGVLPWWRRWRRGRSRA